MTHYSNGKQWALITGASSGLGVDFAHELAADGHNLVLVARREERMHQLASELEARHAIHTRVIAMDLSFPGIGTELKRILDNEAIAIDALTYPASSPLQ